MHRADRHLGGLRDQLSGPEFPREHSVRREARRLAGGIGPDRGLPHRRGHDRWRRHSRSVVQDHGIVEEPGLYFVGEVLDINGHLGGFKFQWAWASGHAASQFV
ncbi:MAG TPA: NAD(P)/FAD-dependent oxidoreductase [Solirubrobacteraceae bacterium]|nr:NAD(P)/FAD-dependent oxidoreductase [Solirubrobacteraceae bacterium]